MRPRWLSLLLCLALLFGQAAAAVHAIGHVEGQLRVNPCAAPADRTHCAPTHDVCPQCVALATLAAAMPMSVAWWLAACTRRWHYPRTAELHVSPVFTPRASSRGPPLLNRLPIRFI